MIILRGIPIAVIIGFVYFLGMELAKRFIVNKVWHDFIPYITYGLSIVYACIATAIFNIDFYASLEVILGILISDSLFNVIHLLVPNAINRFERTPPIEV